MLPKRLFCRLLGHRYTHSALTGGIRPQGGTYKNRFHQVCSRCFREKILVLEVVPDPLGRDIGEVPPEEFRFRVTVE